MRPGDAISPRLRPHNNDERENVDENENRFPVTLSEAESFESASIEKRLFNLSLVLQGRC